MSTTGSVGNDYLINAGGIRTNSAITGKDATQMGMDDFFNLLVAQMTNQDMMNPSADTEFISQMAQFTTLQGMKTIQEYQLSSYATSYAGKNVAIAHVGSDGNMTRTEGMVESVTFYDGEPKVVVNGISYPLYSVMEVKPGESSTAAEDKSSSNEELNQAASYIGKTVTVEFADGEDRVNVEGVVSGVRTGSDGVVRIVIDGNEYLVADITGIVE